MQGASIDIIHSNIVYTDSKGLAHVLKLSDKSLIGTVNFLELPIDFTDNRFPTPATVDNQYIKSLFMASITILPDSQYDFLII